MVKILFTVHCDYQLAEYGRSAGTKVDKIKTSMPGIGRPDIGENELTGKEVINTSIQGNLPLKSY